MFSIFIILQYWKGFFLVMLFPCEVCGPCLQHTSTRVKQCDVVQQGVFTHMQVHISSGLLDVNFYISELQMKEFQLNFPFNPF